MKDFIPGWISYQGQNREDFVANPPTNANLYVHGVIQFRETDLLDDESVAQHLEAANHLWQEFVRHADNITLVKVCVEWDPSLEPEVDESTLYVLSLNDEITTFKAVEYMVGHDLKGPMINEDRPDALVSTREPLIVLRELELAHFLRAALSSKTFGIPSMYEVSSTEDQFRVMFYDPYRKAFHDDVDINLFDTKADQVHIAFESKMDGFKDTSAAYALSEVRHLFLLTPRDEGVTHPARQVTSAASTPLPGTVRSFIADFTAMCERYELEFYHTGNDDGVHVRLGDREITKADLTERQYERLKDRLSWPS